MPAIYDLANRGLLPPGFALTGFARRDWADQDFGQVVYDAVREHARTPFRQDVWDRLAEGFRFVPGSFDDDDVVRPARADRPATSTGSAAPAATTRSTCPSRRRRSRWCASSSPARGCRPRTATSGAGWSSRSRSGTTCSRRIELNEIVNDVFPEESVFRIDHYLGKETVQNILALRFANQLFEPIWNATTSTSVQITMAEDIGLGGRAGLLRRHRRGPRRHPEPPAAAARVHRDGGAHLVLLRRAARREDQGPQRDPAGRTRWTRPPRAASTPAAGRAASWSAASTRRRGSTRTPAPRPTRPSPARSRPGAGRACRSTCAPASGWAGGSPRSR